MDTSVEKYLKEAVKERINNSLATELNEEIFVTEEFKAWFFGYVQALHETSQISAEVAGELRDYLKKEVSLYE